MNRIVLVIGVALSFFSLKAQELNCKVTVGYDKITNVNPQIFKTLETSFNDFMNNTKWTSQSFSKNEKIKSTNTILEIFLRPCRYSLLARYMALLLLLRY